MRESRRRRDAVKEAEGWTGLSLTPRLANPWLYRLIFGP